MESSEDQKGGLSRRAFIQHTGLAGLALGAGTLGPRPAGAQTTEPIEVIGMPGATGIYDPSVTGDLMFFSYAFLTGQEAELPFIDSTGMAKRIDGVWNWAGGVNFGSVEADGTVRKYEVPSAARTPEGVWLASHVMPWLDPDPDNIRVSRQGQVFAMGGDEVAQGQIALRFGDGAWGPERLYETKDIRKTSSDLSDVNSFTEPALIYQGSQLYMALTAHGNEVRIVLFTLTDFELTYVGVLLGEPDVHRIVQGMDHWTATGFGVVGGQLQMGVTPVVDGSYEGGFVFDVTDLPGLVVGSLQGHVLGAPGLTSPYGMLTYDGTQWLFAQTDWNRELFLNVWPSEIFT